MGMVGDAIMEALFVARGNAEHPWHLALDILLAPTIASDEVFGRLKAALYAR